MTYSGKMWVNHIPIDFIRVEVDTSKEFIESHELLINNCERILDNDVVSKSIFKYFNMKFTTYECSTRVILEGSLHALSNRGKHNNNDFTSRDLDRILLDLERKFQIKPKDLHINRLEWGYNLKTNFEVSYFLDRIIEHKSSFKSVGIDDPFDGYYTQFKHSTYRLKLYDKGKQFKLGTKLLRVEISQHNWHKYRAKGIKSLEDFLNSDKNVFKNEILDKLNRITIYDLPLNNYLHPELLDVSFWKDLRTNKHPQQFKRNFDKLKSLNHAYGRQTIEQIKELINLKSDELQL